jgi:hypothetical protein
MKTYSKYFILMLLSMSILQPSCKHDHHEEEATKLKHEVCKSSTQIAKKL